MHGPIRIRGWGFVEVHARPSCPSARQGTSLDAEWQKLNIDGWRYQTILIEYLVINRISAKFLSYDWRTFQSCLRRCSYRLTTI